jgi:hypothetical protein
MDVNARRQAVVNAGFAANGVTAKIGTQNYTVVMAYDTELEGSNGLYLVEIMAEFKTDEMPEYVPGTTILNVDGVAHLMQETVDRNPYVVMVQMQYA